MAQTHDVAIANMKFVPASIPIKAGDTVKWTNTMGMAHTVTPDSGAFPGSGEIAPNGGTYSHTFDAAGAVAYHCEIHPFMKGTVTVT